MRFPYVNLESGKIYNCKPGSWEWWHEKGHIIYNEKEAVGRLQIWQNISLWFWMISITLSVVNKWMLILSIPTLLYYIGVDLYEEWWANRYANAHYLA